ncbi:hypothetical protein LX16_2660 [Stackebrandtia albiflava]|uniref:Alpha/beta hydrolase family protein n=2 Tax=Stackebrandtia albiflava TaxID=406432 RepID=A0A562V276_9ACTN|nr:hypothetical protein LX16_2660 [Stackebrandtia albiflava]
MVVIPGRNFGPYSPLMFLPQLAARRRGAEVVPVSWHRDFDELGTGGIRAEEWVADQVNPALAGLDRPLLVGKSLGSYASLIAANLDLPAVWITPLLHRPEIVAGLKRATAPFMLVGGTADPSWDGDVARGLTPRVCEIPGADHGLMRADRPLADYAAILSEVGTAVERFLDDVWTG